jgi:hypothetical protein
MAKLTMTKIRGFIAAVFALVLVVLLASAGTALLGMDLPVLGTIARNIGIDPAEHGGE